jgi:hypothetical protein
LPEVDDMRVFAAWRDRSPQAARRSAMHGLAFHVAIIATASGAQAQGFSATTYHYDALRTGWNQNETLLTPATVGGGTFGQLHAIALDDQIDAQPLVIANGISAGHDAVYVATANNTIYRIDSATGSVVKSRNFGTPVPRAVLPGQCDANGNHVGID